MPDTKITSTGNVVDYTVQKTGLYDITAFGAQGGAGMAGGGADGAEISGVFQLTQGEVLKVVVGGAGASYANGGGGGGGGSFVIETSTGSAAVHDALVIAGGGGGGPFNAVNGLGQGGLIGTSGGAGAGTGGGIGGLGGLGGSGNGVSDGGGGGYAGGSGGGINTNGTAGSGRSGNYAGGASNYAHGGFGGGGGGGANGGGGGGGFGGGGGGGGGGYAYNGYANFDGGGGGGGSFNGGTNQVMVTAEHAGNGVVTINAICYLRGTRILTPKGEVFVEDLRPGDMLVTRFGGVRPVKWVGRQSYNAQFVRNTPDRLPVCIKTGALGAKLPTRDLYVSPGHSMLIDGTLVLAKHLVNGITVTQDYAPARIDYFNIELSSHDCVMAEGTWAETYANVAGIRAQFHNAAEYTAMYADDDATVPLCAARPEPGEALATLLRAVAIRATAAAASTGPMRGYIDQVVGQQIDGWAQDVSHPDLPVLLEVLLNGNVIGTALACALRNDLQAAGIGQGRCAFTFTAPVPLEPALLASLQIRRLTDGAVLPASQDCIALRADEQRQVA